MRVLTEQEKESLGRFAGFENGKPRYRIEFAPNLFHFVDSEPRYKYPDPESPDEDERPKPLWVLEKYYPPSFFGNPNDWDLSFGPYPENGEYVFRAFLANENGGFLPVSDAMFELVCLIIEMDKSFGNLSPKQQEELVMSYYAKRRENKEKQAEENKAELNEEGMLKQHKLGLNKEFSKNLVLPTLKEIKEYAN